MKKYSTYLLGAVLLGSNIYLCLTNPQMAVYSAVFALGVVVFKKDLQELKNEA